ncbi:hypothetical protein FKM82_009423 [Ascaphus truei]
MKCPSVECPTSSERRLAWAQQTRHWHNTVDEDDTVAAIMSIPEFTYDVDDVFLEAGRSTKKIQDWLQDCRSSIENISSEDTLRPHIKGPCSKGNSVDDDLTLGAEAPLLSDNCKSRGRMMLAHPRPKNLHLGNSVTSNSTNKTSSSVSEILEMCQENAENILYNLGFANEEPNATAKIPGRFFFFPSLAAGIDFRVFLESQVRRMGMEDSSYILPNHEAMTATADALYCLYSHLTSTPVWNIATNPGFWTYADITNINASLLKEDHFTSPIDHLRNAISSTLYSSNKPGLTAKYH